MTLCTCHATGSYGCPEHEPDPPFLEMPSAPVPDLAETGKDLEAQVKVALDALEKNGISARNADEFIRDCVFNAWWDWDYEGPCDE